MRHILRKDLDVFSHVDCMIYLQNHAKYPLDRMDILPYAQNRHDWQVFLEPEQMQHRLLSHFL